MGLDVGFLVIRVGLVEGPFEPPVVVGLDVGDTVVGDMVGVVVVGLKVGVFVGDFVSFVGFGVAEPGGYTGDAVGEEDGVVVGLDEGANDTGGAGVGAPSDTQIVKSATVKIYTSATSACALICA